MARLARGRSSSTARADSSPSSTPARRLERRRDPDDWSRPAVAQLVPRRLRPCHGARTAEGTDQGRRSSASARRRPDFQLRPGGCPGRHRRAARPCSKPARLHTTTRSRRSSRTSRRSVPDRRYPSTSTPPAPTSAGGVFYPDATARPATTPPASAARSATGATRRRSTTRPAAGRAKRCRTGPGQMPVFDEQTYLAPSRPTIVARLRASTCKHPTTAVASRSAGSVRSPRASLACCSARRSVSSSPASGSWGGRAMPVATESRRLRAAQVAAERLAADLRFLVARRGCRSAWPSSTGRRAGQPQLEGILLASRHRRHRHRASCIWAKHFMPARTVRRGRGEMASSEDGERRVRRELRARRRGGSPGAGFLGRLLAAGRRGAARCSPLFPDPFARSATGARPQDDPLSRRRPLSSTERRASRCAGDTLAVGGVITVLPARAPRRRATRRRCSSTLGPVRTRPRPGREDWAVGDLVAYSKLCTHVGCPVGLYQAQCGLAAVPVPPVDVRASLDGASPIFGPAARSLPQLPLGDRRRTATSSPRGDFSGPVGPGFWDQRHVMAGQDAAHLARLVRWADRSPRRAPTSPAAARTRSSPTTGRSCSASCALYCFVVLVAHGRLPHVLLRRPARRRSIYHGSYGRCGACEMSRPTSRPSTSASTCAPAWSCARSTTGRRCCSWPPSSAHLAACSSPAPSAGPARLNWMIGVTLLILAMVNGFAGYSLLDDQLSGTGLRIAYCDRARRCRSSARGSRRSLFGGEFPGPEIARPPLRHPHPDRPGR